MTKQIFVNLPVKDLKKSMSFFAQLGFEFNPQFTNDQAACLILGENIYAMLLVENLFKTFTHKDVCDTRKNTEALLCISAESRAQIEELVAAAVQAGGSAPRPPQDHGFMYGHGFEDLDGHTWELMYMNPEAIQKR
jgi:predicted lactoylglutathione lyase